MRPTVQGIKIILKGDTSTTKGNVLTGSSDGFMSTIEIALIGDKVFCPACKTTGTIVEGTPMMTIKTIPVALEGHMVICQCPKGAHRLIAR